MDIDLTKYSYQGEWVEFRPADPDKGTPPVRLLIRPYPQSMNVSGYKTDGSIVLSGTATLKKFDYCLVNWENLEITQNGEKQDCTSEAKKILYDFDIEGIGTFVLVEAAKLEARRAADLKN